MEHGLRPITTSRHIDTALRFSAEWFVKNPHEFAMEVVAGNRIDKIKDQTGSKLTDAYLIKLHSEDYPWLPDVYKNLSGYIHFSDSHVLDSISSLRDDMQVYFEITATDYKFPESSWVEILKCASEATAMLARYLEGYIIIKGLSSEELLKLRDAANYTSGKLT